jgi:nitroreductase
MLAPTSFNIQNWRFVVIENPALRQQLKTAAWNQAQISDASLVVVICGDLQAWAKQPFRYWRNLSDVPTRDYLLNAMHNFYVGKPQVQRDEVMRSAGLAAQTLMLTAKAMGYDSCPMVGFNFDEVATLINLPDDHAIAMIVTVGKAVKAANPRSGALDYDEVVIQNQFAAA